MYRVPNIGARQNFRTPGFSGAYTIWLNYTVLISSSLRGARQWSLLKSTPPKLLSERGFSTSHSTLTSREDGLSPNPNLFPANIATENRCQGRAVLVTGGTSGIGYAVTKSFALEGASHIVITTRDATRGAGAINRIKKETGLEDVSISVAEANITDREKFSKLFKDFSECNTIVNCAGITQSELLYRANFETIDKVIDTNLKGSIMLASLATRHFLDSFKQLKRQSSSTTTQPKDGATSESTPKSFCLVNVSSLLAMKSGYGASSYAASKAGIIALTRTLCLESAELAKRFSPSSQSSPSFRANVVVPGYIDTPMLSEYQGKSREELEQKIPLGRFGKAEEVAEAVLFLVTNEYANNCVLNLDGGLSAT